LSTFLSFLLDIVFPTFPSPSHLFPWSSAESTCKNKVSRRKKKSVETTTTPSPFLSIPPPSTQFRDVSHRQLSGKRVQHSQRRPAAFFTSGGEAE
jgi:hypothetical protein